MSAAMKKQPKVFDWLDAIITTDADFGQVEELTIYTCNPALLQRQAK